MASDWQIMCDALIEELTLNVVGLSDAVVHRYIPWDPENLTVSDGKRHLAVFPNPENAEIAEPLAGSAHMLNKIFVVLIWEPAPDEGSRGIADEEASLEFMELQEATRDQLYVDRNQILAGWDRVWYDRTIFPGVISGARQFALSISARKQQSFT